MSDKIMQLTDDSFEADVLKAAGPVLVDFWAEWCGPCKMIAPILDEIAEEYAGKVTIGKLNIDQNAGTPPKFGIRGIPTLLLFKDGSVAATKVGAVSKTQLKEFLDANL
ncbi:MULTISPECIES: thioredoxin TrxA [Salinivibrio]|jgi:thioredoxin 1|uniref:Thioredoxin n=3 Tax=Salinivibrio TaxID=51366 RepID=A0A1V3GLK5_9GAMM|nr:MULTISPECIES: thioredoxin TrxA [Salinivibrio]NUY55417.1 thioredoxin TrxA [Salinivibrio sp. EAGSL]ODP98131.1 thioredoxin [Salinivibrio sp. BNH]OOE32532.1 thiol reductase thioredoxin [Salinivibrio kushneri]OOE38141.1 thiol reductase thioredoxin [Salinivibrio kushneri]OOE38397.1 thiol reductase thioredoxin [Salinivibrio kushneri]